MINTLKTYKSVLARERAVYGFSLINSHNTGIDPEILESVFAKRLKQITIIEIKVSMLIEFLSQHQELTKRILTGWPNSFKSTDRELLQKNLLSQTSSDLLITSEELAFLTDIHSSSMAVNIEKGFLVLFNRVAGLPDDTEIEIDGLLNLSIKAFSVNSILTKIKATDVTSRDSLQTLLELLKD